MSAPTVSPAKAGAQVQSESLVGFTWIPAFAGTIGVGCGGAGA
jgi:hypothetical protein